MGIKALLCVKGSLCNLSVYVYSASKRKEKKIPIVIYYWIIT